MHTRTSVRWFVAQDLERRSQTMARLVATGAPLVYGDAGSDLQEECREVLAAGPPPLSADDLSLARYALTDLLDDLAGSDPGPARTAVAVGLWRQTAELALAAAGAWRGTGKWLVRELAALDRRNGTDLTGRLDASLRAALSGDVGPLVEVADEVLDPAGGRLWAGFRLDAPPEARWG